MKNPFSLQKLFIFNLSLNQEDRQAYDMRSFDNHKVLKSHIFHIDVHLQSEWKKDGRKKYSEEMKNLVGEMNWNCYLCIALKMRMWRNW